MCLANYYLPYIYSFPWKLQNIYRDFMVALMVAIKSSDARYDLRSLRQHFNISSRLLVSCPEGR
jgi:VanZ family protein